MVNVLVPFAFGLAEWSASAQAMRSSCVMCVVLLMVPMGLRVAYLRLIWLVCMYGVKQPCVMCTAKVLERGSSVVY